MSLADAAAPPPLPTVPATRAGRALSFAARHWWLTLSLLCLVLWTPGVLTLPPLDRDESRFAQSSKQMLETLNFIDIRFGHVPRYKKPAGIYWLQSATTAIAGMGDKTHIWTYRLPSLLGGILAVLLCFWTARAFAIPEVSWLAAALMATSLLLTAESTIATTDAVQLACVMGAIGVLLRVYLAARDANRPQPTTTTVLLGWVALAAGTLVKGPLVLGICAVTIVALIAWDREWRWLKGLKPLYGVPLTLALVAPWAIAISLESHGAFYQQSLGQDFAAKLAGGQESHGAWPGYYLLLVTFTFWPAILFIAPGCGAALRRMGDAPTRFLLAWAGASWLLFELVPTKLPHYVLPAYPALAMLAAHWMLTPRDDAERPWQPILFVLAAVQFALGVVTFAMAPALAPIYVGSGLTWWLIALGAVGAIFGLTALILYLRRSVLLAGAFAVLAILVFYPTITVGAAPRLTELWVSPDAAALIARHTVQGDPPPILAGYTEPSLVFLLGTETRLTDGAGAADNGAFQGGLALIEDAERPAFLARLAELEADAVPVDEMRGLNYSRGKKVHLTLYRVTATHDVTVPPAE
ncbi:MAG: glycosyltransferase family 39 protein [Alphaproteobacteria bacterium]|nr:glycosyltransferase family 39 protein [Alphaproteobacteria bacterium]MBV9419454.1 glycosyltransferase family 39 protein [Alphaproteobacteria bacterium]